jgi:SAM-dependent methyltransferase
MKESSKAMERRLSSEKRLLFSEIFKNAGIDIGAGDDLIKVDGSVVGFDMEDGDANQLHEYFPEESFDFIHASQCLEHMRDPKAALESWLKVLRKDGYAVISVPSWELYEGMIWPSRFNPDHKSTWSLWQKGSPAPTHVWLPEFLEYFTMFDYKLIYCELIDTNYNYKIGTSVDQTYPYENRVEAFIEFVLRKR